MSRGRDDPGPSSQQVPSWWLRCCNTASPFGYTGQLGGSLWERRVRRSHVDKKYVVWHFHDWYEYGSKCECCYFLASVKKKMISILCRYPFRGVYPILTHLSAKRRGDVNECLPDDSGDQCPGPDIEVPRDGLQMNRRKLEMF